MSNKKTVTNMTGLPLPLSDRTLGVAETAEVNHDHTVTNYLADGFLAEVEEKSKIVGEEGPELVDLPAGSTIKSPKEGKK